MMAWHKVSTSGNPLESPVAESSRVWEPARASPASRPFQESTLANALETTAVVSAQTQLTSVTLTSEKNTALPIDASSVSGKASLICTQEVEKLNEAFDFLLAFFILACVLIIILIYKVIQFKQKLKALEDSVENRLEYYSFYQSASVIQDKFCGIINISVEALHDVMTEDPETRTYKDCMLMSQHEEPKVTEDEEPPTEQDKRKKMLALKDPVHTVSLQQFIYEKLKAQQEILGEQGFQSLMETVDTEIVTQLQEFLQGF